MTATLYDMNKFRKRAFGEPVVTVYHNKVSSEDDSNYTLPSGDRNEPITASTGSKLHLAKPLGEPISNVRLYGNTDETNSNATAALIACSSTVAGLLRRTVSELDEGDEIGADLSFMEAKNEGRRLLDAIYLSDGVGLLISAVLRTFSSINYAKNSQSAIGELIRVLEEIGKKPNISFSSAIVLSDALEQVSDTPELAILAELRASLIGDSSDDA